MAGQKFLFNNAGQTTEKAAIQTSAGAGDAGKIPALNGSGLIDPTMLAATSGLIVVSATATATITAGQVVNVSWSGTVLQVKPADNTTAGSEANGFASAGITSGASGSITMGEGLITGLSALSTGLYYLGTNGAVTATPPATAGNLLQQIGRATSATTFYFQPSLFTIVLA